jgi:hypothetical protein
MVARRRRNWLLQLLVFIAWLGILTAVVVGTEQDISHFSDFTLDTAWCCWCSCFYAGSFNPPARRTSHRGPSAWYCVSRDR